MIKKVILMALILVLVGCQKAEEPKTETMPATSETTPEEISIDSDIAEIDSLKENLYMEDLDSIETELDEINW